MGKHSEKQSYRKRPKSHGKSWRARSNQVSNVSYTNYCSNFNIFHINHYSTGRLNRQIYHNFKITMGIKSTFTTSNDNNVMWHNWPPAAHHIVHLYRQFMLHVWKSLNAVGTQTLTPFMIKDVLRVNLHFSSYCITLEKT